MSSSKVHLVCWKEVWMVGAWDMKIEWFLSGRTILDHQMDGKQSSNMTFMYK